MYSKCKLYFFAGAVTTMVIVYLLPQWVLKGLLREVFLSLQKEAIESKKMKRPKRIIIIRHGESMGNVDSSLYSKIPDNQIPLSETGIQQAIESGKRLRDVVGSERCRFFVSPYVRTCQTFDHISSALDPMQFSVREEARLREQDFGNFQDVRLIKEAQKERSKFGPFYFRFPHGESAADVYDRMSSFWDSLYRKFEKADKDENFILITHGITTRVFLARYFKWDVETFHMLRNPGNCQMYVMLRDDANWKYYLTQPMERHSYSSKSRSSSTV